MKILVVSSEVVPFAKTGGLADVAGSLPIEFARMGHDVRVAMPKYESIDEEAFNLIRILDDIHVRLNDTVYLAQIKRTVFPDTNVPVYFVQNAAFFDRGGLYQVDGKDYPDNALRFAFFCKAVIWLMKGLDWIPDIIHCNDWQTALVPVYLKTNDEMQHDAALSQIKVLFTIHNLAYQGVFDAKDAPMIDIGPDLFHPAALEFYSRLNLMKGGILFADRITTVSPTYAKEIQTAEYGAGLDGVLVSRRAHISGILNGIDTAVWNPETDPLIPEKFSLKKPGGKAKCKEALQQEIGLRVAPDVPLIGIISRLDPQKGFDIISDAMPELVATGAQLALLGTGIPAFHTYFEKLAKKHPGQVSVNLKFDNGLAHRIEAGSDMFLMPSRYEPCGLNQLFSLRYGTIPIVRKTGGLADSIHDATPGNIASGEGTGFVFKEYTGGALMTSVNRALQTYGDKTAWKKLVKNAMLQDFSWGNSAREYGKLFEQMTER